MFFGHLHNQFCSCECHLILRIQVMTHPPIKNKSINASANTGMFSCSIIAYMLELWKIHKVPQFFKGSETNISQWFLKDKNGAIWKHRYSLGFLKNSEILQAGMQRKIAAKFAVAELQTCCRTCMRRYSIKSSLPVISCTLSNKALSLCDSLLVSSFSLTMQFPLILVIPHSVPALGLMAASLFTNSKDPAALWAESIGLSFWLIATSSPPKCKVSIAVAASPARPPSLTWACEILLRILAQHSFLNTSSSRAMCRVSSRGLPVQTIELISSSTSWASAEETCNTAASLTNTTPRPKTVSPLRWSLEASMSLCAFDLISRRNSSATLQRPNGDSIRQGHKPTNNSDTVSDNNTRLQNFIRDGWSITLIKPLVEQQNGTNLEAGPPEKARRTLSDGVTREWLLMAVLNLERRLAWRHPRHMGSDWLATTRATTPSLHLTQNTSWLPVRFFCGAQQASWEPQDDEPHVAESQAMAAKLHLCAQNPCSVAHRTEEATTNTAAHLLCIACWTQCKP